MNINTIEELLENIDKRNNIYIYGAGLHGLLVALILKKNNIKVISFIESIKTKKHIYDINIPVIQYDEYKDNNSMIIVAVSDKNTKVIINKIRNYNYSIVTEKFFSLYCKKYKKKLDRILENNAITVYSKKEIEGLYYRDFFNDLYDNFYSSIRWLNLISGLSEESIDILKNSLERIKIIKENKTENFDIFKPEEKKLLIHKNKELYSKINEEGKGWYKYKDYYLPINDFRTEVFVDKLGIKSLNCNIFMEKSIIDVGGYIGDSSIVLSKYTRDKVHVFEPIPNQVELLKKTIKMNKKEINIIINQKAVSDFVGITEFFCAERDYVSGTKEIKSRKYTKKIEVSVTTIDDYVNSNKLNVGLLKIHAEGAEQEVLKGAIKTIQKDSPSIIIEINHTESDFFDIKSLLEKINPKYRFKIFMPSNGFVMLGLKLLAEI